MTLTDREVEILTKEIVDLNNGVLKNMTPDQRVTFFHESSVKFCRYCGTEVNGEHCYCTNDE